MWRLEGKAAIAILIAATLLTLPAALGPVRVNDSFWIDWVWLDQFARELQGGVVYPRWLPLSHGGLGSPVFYYYPPLAFYAGSAFVSAGLSVYGALLATFFAGYVLSGAGMYLWLRDQARRPLIGALVYMIAPYHACNFYLRGAVAEFLATAFLPFVMLGLRHLHTRPRNALAVTALSYAALICSHLPLALLASVFLLGPYAVIQVRRAPRQSVYVIAALATGVMLAGAYLLPALALAPYRDAAVLWKNPVLQPQNWTFWHEPMPRAYLAMLVIGAALALPLVTLVATERSRWAMFGLGCVLLGIGLIPVMWTLPLIRSVQFPFRIFPIAEFALATALAGATGRLLLLGISSLPLLALTGSIVMGPRPPGGVPMAELRAFHPDVPENLPPGQRPYSWPSRWALGVASSHRQSQFNDGVTIEPVFYFPTWRVLCGGRPASTFPAPETQLLSYRGQSCSRSLVWTAPEKIGAALSALGLLVLLFVSVAGKAHWLRASPLVRKGSGEEVTT
jgi:hypothetical protein